MEFWGVEVRQNEPFKVDPGDGKVVHVSQVALGESKKDRGTEPIYVYMNVDNKKFVIGQLSHDKYPQITMELLVQKGFELSHSWKNGSVYFSGYKVQAINGISETDEDTDEEPIFTAAHAKREVRPKEVQPDEKSADVTKLDGGKKKQVTFGEPSKDVKGKEESDSDEDDETTAEDSSDDEGQTAKTANGGEESSDEDEESSDDSDDEVSSDEESPKQPEQSKKRPAESVLKTPSVDKKVKLGTPHKSDGRKSSHTHVATPHPTKQAGKKSFSGEQPKQGTPKPAGAYSCKACNRSFSTEMGLQDHTKAKHSSA